MPPNVSDTAKTILNLVITNHYCGGLEFKKTNMNNISILVLGVINHLRYIDR